MITFDKTEFDLGNVKYGQTVTVTAIVTNTNSVPVSLSTTNSSCSCTTGQVEYSTLNPNSKSEFKITFNSNKSGRGTQAKSINLDYTIDRVTKSKTFRIKANVI